MVDWSDESLVATMVENSVEQRGLSWAEKWEKHWAARMVDSMAVPRDSMMVARTAAPKAVRLGEKTAA